MLLHGSKEAKMPSFITIAICGGYIHKMTGLDLMMLDWQQKGHLPYKFQRFMQMWPIMEYLVKTG